VGKVIGIQRVKAIERASMGDKKKMIEEAEKGFDGSFMKSFTPSAIGCNRPYGPTRVGPFRACIYPRAFRSPRVIKATERRTGTIIRRMCIKVRIAGNRVISLKGEVV
jgi:hypothetical protein